MQTEKIQITIDCWDDKKKLTVDITAAYARLCEKLGIASLTELAGDDTKPVAKMVLLDYKNGLITADELGGLMSELFFEGKAYDSTDSEYLDLMIILEDLNFNLYADPEYAQENLAAAFAYFKI